MNKKFVAMASLVTGICAFVGTYLWNKAPDYAVAVQTITVEPGVSTMEYTKKEMVIDIPETGVELVTSNTYFELDTIDRRHVDAVRVDGQPYRFSMANPPGGRYFLTYYSDLTFVTTAEVKARYEPAIDERNIFDYRLVLVVLWVLANTFGILVVAGLTVKQSS